MLKPIATTTPASLVNAPATMRCPVCASGDVDDFFHLERLPIHVGVLHDSAESARNTPIGRVTLTHCASCGMVFNRAFQPEKLVFTPGYEVQLVHSPIFRAFLESVAERLVERYGLRNKRVVDIGCGAGHFLRILCERGGNRGLGIDPTLTRTGSMPVAAGEMELVRDLFGREKLDADFDFASCQSVLEDIPDPVAFMAEIRRLIERRRGQVYLEVFNAFRAFQAGETWSICYEQCNYYSLATFTEAIRNAGFRILAAGGCYGDDQYIYVEAAPGDVRRDLVDTPRIDTADSSAVVERFATLHAARVALWNERIAQFRARGTRAVVWGSGGKGICFLNTFEAADVFTVVIDINPDRQGQFVPGSGQQIVSPAWLKEHRPDVVILTNPLYEAEIRTTVAELGVNCDFLTI